MKLIKLFTIHPPRIRMNCVSIFRVIPLDLPGMATPKWREKGILVVPVGEIIAWLHSTNLNPLTSSNVLTGGDNLEKMCPSKRIFAGVPDFRSYLRRHMAFRPNFFSFNNEIFVPIPSSLNIKGLFTVYFQVNGIQYFCIVFVAIYVERDSIFSYRKEITLKTVVLKYFFIQF